VKDKKRVSSPKDEGKPLEVFMSELWIPRSRIEKRIQELENFQLLNGVYSETKWRLEELRGLLDEEVSGKGGGRMGVNMKSGLAQVAECGEAAGIGRAPARIKVQATTSVRRRPKKPDKKEASA
jgi:hypothetical protein